jgi:uncharacterized protein (TIGR03435 family)
VGKGVSAVIAIVILEISSAATQVSPTPTFEAASIKPNKSVPDVRRAGFQPGGRFLAQNMPLRSLIAIAYGDPRPLALYQIVGGPGWTTTEGFDVEAKAQGNFPETEGEPGFSTIGELMLRALLVERFKLAVHTETRQLPVYDLKTARSDGRLGLQLTRSSGADCASSPSPAGSPSDPNALPRCGSFVVMPGTAGMLHARGRFLTIDQLVKNLQTFVGRPVLDRTALSGAYSCDFDFKPGSPAPVPTGVGSIDARPSDDSSTYIYTALQEQLGLKLDAATGPVNVIVIDSAERPASN